MPGLFRNVSNSGRANFRNISNSGRANFRILNTTSTTTTTTTMATPPYSFTLQYSASPGPSGGACTSLTTFTKYSYNYAVLTQGDTLYTFISPGVYQVYDSGTDYISDGTVYGQTNSSGIVGTLTACNV